MALQALYEAQCAEHQCHANSAFLSELATLDNANPEDGVPCVRALSFEYNLVGPLGAKPVAALCRELPSLQKLNLRGNRLDNQSAAALAVHLSGHPSLKVLDLRDNLISHQGGKRLLGLVQATEALQVVKCDRRLINLAIARRMEAVLIARQPEVKPTGVSFSPPAKERLPYSFAAANAVDSGMLGDRPARDLDEVKAEMPAAHREHTVGHSAALYGDVETTSVTYGESDADDIDTDGVFITVGREAAQIKHPRVAAPVAAEEPQRKPAAGISSDGLRTDKAEASAFPDDPMSGLGPEDDSPLGRNLTGQVQLIEEDGDDPKRAPLPPGSGLALISAAREAQVAGRRERESENGSRPSSASSLSALAVVLSAAK